MRKEKQSQKHISTWILSVLALVATAGLLFSAVKAPAFANAKPAEQKKVVIEVVEDIPADEIEDGDVALAAGAEAQTHGNEYYAQAWNILPVICIAVLVIVLLMAWRRHRRQEGKLVPEPARTNRGH